MLAPSSVREVTSFDFCVLVRLLQSPHDPFYRRLGHLARRKDLDLVVDGCRGRRGRRRPCDPSCDPNRGHHVDHGNGPRARAHDNHGWKNTCHTRSLDASGWWVSATDVDGHDGHGRLGLRATSTQG